MQKAKVYAEIPEYNQETQAVHQLEPVEMEDYIFYGVDVVEMPPQEAGEEDE